MKIHLQQIPDAGKHFEGEADPSILDVRDPDIVPESQIHYSLDAGLSDGGFFATGSLSVDLRLRCVRCLEEFCFPIRITDFACQIELTGSETVDLTPLAREDILLALPSHPHCDWDESRLCRPSVHAPGAVFPGRSSGAPENSQEPESSREVWTKLDQLNFDRQ